MRLWIIRHAKVDLTWPIFCSSEEFDEDCEKYDRADIYRPEQGTTGRNAGKIYTSELERTQKTAEALLGRTDFEVTGLINEVPARSSFDCRQKIPRVFWNISGRLQWFFNSGRQLETRRETVERADEMIRRLMAGNEDCAIVIHGFFMVTLVRRLKLHGFSVRNRSVRYANLAVVEAERDT